MEKLKKSEAALAADSTDGLIKRKGKAILGVLMVNLIDFINQIMHCLKLMQTSLVILKGIQLSGLSFSAN